MPAPYARSSPSSYSTPNSSVNQKTSAIICSAASVWTRSVAAPAARLSAANRGEPSMFPWPMTSWMMSGSGVYSGCDGWRTYCVLRKLPRASEP